MRPVVHLHVGMHKTGTTAIQSALAAHRGDPEVLRPEGRVNPMRVVGLAFRDPPPKQFLRPGDDPAERRAAMRDVLAAALARSDRPAVLSSELFATLKPPQVADVLDLLRAHAARVEVIAYLRPPRGYLRSVVQQAVRTVPLRPDSEALMHGYRRSVGPWRRAADATLVSYEAARAGADGLLGDFARRIGLPSDGLRAVPDASNPSLSLEATAVLAAWREVAGPASGAEAIAAGLRLGAAMGGFGATRRWSFAGPRTDALLAARAADAAWAARALGDPGFADDPPRGATVDLDGLPAVADAARDALAAWLAEAHGLRAPGGASVPDLVARLHAAQAGSAATRLDRWARGLRATVTRPFRRR